MEENSIQKTKNKQKILKEYYIPLASVALAAIALLSNILITYINSRSQIEMKQFEITYLEKRKSYTDILTSVSKIKSFMLDLSYNANPNIYNKNIFLVNEVNHDLDSLKKYHKLEGSILVDDTTKNTNYLIDNIGVELDNLTIHSNFVHPFLGNDEFNRVTWINKTTEFKIKIKQFLQKYIEREKIKLLNSFYKSLDGSNIIPKYKNKELIDTISIESTGQITINYIAPFEEYILRELYNQLFLKN